MKHFQPNGKCGNCQFYRHSLKDKNNKMMKEAGCKKDCEPRKCAEEFSPKNKKDKRMKNRAKKWERQFSY